MDHDWEGRQMELNTSRAQPPVDASGLSKTMGSDQQYAGAATVAEPGGVQKLVTKLHKQRRNRQGRTDLGEKQDHPPAFVWLSDREVISVPRAMLQRHSSMLEHVLDREVTLGSEQSPIRIADATSFRIILHWMHTGNLITDNKRPGLRGEIIKLVHVWHMANILGIPDICNQAIARMRPQAHTVAGDPDLARLIWNLRPTGAELRGMFLTQCAQNFRFECFTGDRMPMNFLVDLVRELGEACGGQQLSRLADEL